MDISPVVFDESRKALHKKMSEAYVQYLKFVFDVNINNTEAVAGHGEWLLKFLSSYYITNAPVNYMLTEEIRRKFSSGPNRRYLLGDYYSLDAIEILKKGEISRKLSFEHMIPKSHYIQKPSEVLARNERLTADIVCDLLNRYWYIAVISKEEENDLIKGRRMPAGWDEESIFTRYKNLIGKNKLFPYGKFSP